jgi:hypothetical protein
VSESADPKVLDLPSSRAGITQKDTQILTNFVEKFGYVNMTSFRQLTWVTLHWKFCYRLWRFVKSLPTHVVHYEGRSPSASAIPAFSWRHPTALHGFARACLLLPINRSDYFKGPSRQNLRTRTSGATRLGYTTRPLLNNEIAGVVEAVCLARGWHEFRHESISEVLSVEVEDACGVATFDTEGVPCAFAIGIQAGDAFTLKWAFSTMGPPRWQCFSGLIEYCYAEGLRTIIEDPVMLIKPSLLVFQDELGFVDVNLKLKRRK